MRRLTQGAPHAAQSRPPAPAVRAARPVPRPSFAPPALVQLGRPLAGPVRAEMERGFGQDLGHVRVHDGEPAHTTAVRLDARAFSFGDHLVFARGAYRPDAPDGRGLLVHEIAHALQGGAADDARAEAEADEAARAIAAGRRPTVTRLPGAPRVHRSGNTAAPPPSVPAPTPASAPGAGSAPETAPAQPATTAGPAVKLPPGMRVIKDDPPGLGTNELVVEMASFTLPMAKGAGEWVQKAHNDLAAGGGLVFSPIFLGNQPAAFKEGREGYKSIWLGRFGFPSLQALSSAITAASATNEKVRESLEKADVQAVVKGMKTNDLSNAGCDVDHIVEKQMGGTSIPSNLQLLTQETNREAGWRTRQALLNIVSEIRHSAMRGENVHRLQIQFAQVTVPPGKEDASVRIEKHLRAGDVVGSDAVKVKAEGKPVALSVGGRAETVSIRDTGWTPLDRYSKRIVPGMRLNGYTRDPGGVAGKPDTVDGNLDSRTVNAVKPEESLVKLGARLVPAATAPPAAGTDPSAPQPGEVRVLTIDRAANTKIAFYYPYLSQGTLTSLGLDGNGNLTGEGTIKPSVPFLGTLNVKYSNGDLRLAAPIPADKLVSPMPGTFRFTGGQLELQLSPVLVPSGNLTVAVGPAARPILLGDLTVTMAGGALVASGTLTPGGKLPGITAAAGEVTWNSKTGWSGRITATSSSIPRATQANVEIGFATKDGKFTPYASGGVETQIRGAALHLGAGWDAEGLSYQGSVVVPKPLPLVERVKLAGRYSDRGMLLEGDAAIVWRTLTSTMHVRYSHKPEEPEGRFSGAATFAIKTPKAEGSLSLTFDEQGHIFGKGTVGYQVTKNLRPVLGIELTKEEKIKVSGEVAVGDIPLTKMWPSPQGGNVSIIKGLGAKFSIPTPVPGVTAFGEVRGSLGLGYGVGPVMLKGVVFKGELYPLQDDPQVRAKLTGTLAVPAYGEVSGTFGAYIGLEVALGAVGAKGGINISPKLRISGEGGVKFDAEYGSEGFSFSADSFAAGRLTASAEVNLVAEIYAVYGVFTHTWTYQVASVSAQIGPEIRLTLGRIAYAKDGELTWPSLAQIKAEPTVDPLRVVQEMMGRGKAHDVRKGQAR